MNDSLNDLAQKIIDGLQLEDMTPDDIDPDTPLFGTGLGLDSIDALELSVLVSRSYGIQIDNNEQGRTAFVSLRTLHTFITHAQK